MSRPPCLQRGSEADQPVHVCRDLLHTILLVIKGSEDDVVVRVCREHIKTCLLAARDSEDDVTAPAGSAVLLDANDFPTNSHFSGWDKFAAARSASGASSPPPGPTQRPAARAAPPNSPEAAESKLQAAQDTPKPSGVATQAAGRAGSQPAETAPQAAGNAAPAGSHPAEGASQAATGYPAPGPNPDPAPQAARAPSPQAHPRRSMAASAGPRPSNADPARPNPGGLQELLHKRQASLALRSAASRPRIERPRLPGRPQVWGDRAASEAADLAERGRAGPPAALHGGAQAAHMGAPIPEARQAAGQAGAAPVPGPGAAQPAQLGSQGSGHAAGHQGSMEQQASAGQHNTEEAGGAPCLVASRRGMRPGLLLLSSPYVPKTTVGCAVKSCQLCIVMRCCLFRGRGWRSLQAASSSMPMSLIPAVVGEGGFKKQSRTCLICVVWVWGCIVNRIAKADGACSSAAACCFKFTFVGCRWSARQPWQTVQFSRHD